MENLLRQVDAIKSQGMFFLPISGDLKQPSCATRDIANVAAKLLLDHSWSGQGSLPVMGPEDLSYDDMAQMMSEVLGKPVRFHQIPGEAFKARLEGRGMSDAMAQANLEMWTAYGQGLATGEPRTPESTTPTSFRQWCEEVLKPRSWSGYRQRVDPASAPRQRHSEPRGARVSPHHAALASSGQDRVMLLPIGSAFQ